MADAGEIGEADVGRNPGGDHAGGCVGIDKVRKAERQAGQAEENGREVRATGAGDKAQAGACLRGWRGGREERPAAGHQEGVFGETQPHSDIAGRAGHARELQHNHPTEQKCGHGEGREAGGALDEQSQAAGEQQCAGEAGEDCARGNPQGNGLPVQGEVAGEEAEDAKASQAEGEEKMTDAGHTHCLDSCES